MTCRCSWSILLVWRALLSKESIALCSVDLSRAVLSILPCRPGRMRAWPTAPTPRAPGPAPRPPNRSRTIAREHLATDGPNLSLRAVARDLGVVSSAVYRYFASRDELLTALIVDAYVSLADAVEAAEAAVAAPRHDGTLAGAVAGPPATGRWPTRTSTRCSTAAPSPGTPRPWTRWNRRCARSSSRLRILADGLERGTVRGAGRPAGPAPCARTSTGCAATSASTACPPRWWRGR